MAISEMEKLLRFRKKEIALLNSYGKNIGSDSIYFIHGNELLGETIKSEFYPAISVARGFDLEGLYLDPSKYYRVEGAKLYKVLSGKEIDVQINGGCIKVTSTEGKYSIKPADKKEYKNIRNLAIKYKLDDEFCNNEITETAIANMDRSIPIILPLETFNGQISIRYMNKFFKTNFKETNVESINIGTLELHEQVYILKCNINKIEGTKTSPRIVEVISYYGIVPLKN